MQICPNCGKDNIEGTIFCAQCGVALVPVPLATRQLGGGDAQGVINELGSDRVLILQVGNEPNPIMVQINKEVVLGRLSDQTEDKTYINLTPYNAEDLGVSRQHCRLLRDNKAVYLMDLNSTNGTRHNGEVLPSSVEKRLRDGDELLLGKLKLYVFFKH
jgi:pSer/pThr/pTyr-binding forkhead associated (FHA) protein